MGSLYEWWDTSNSKN